MSKKKPIEDAHVLIPDELVAELPRLYATENETDPVARLKFFTPDAQWTWYLTEYDPEQRLAFGLVKGLDTELGYFSIEELEEVRGPLGLQVERDLYFDPQPVSKCR